jgi:hypothetical protein
MAACFAGTRVPRRVVMTYSSASVDALPPPMRAVVRAWREANPDVELVYYGDDAARAFLVAHYGSDAARAWDALRPGAYRADLLRYGDLLRHGGVYADIKCELRAPLASLVGPRGTLVVDRWDIGVWNGFLAAPPGAEWLRHALQRAISNTLGRRYGVNSLDVTGPSCLGRGVREWMGASPSATPSCAVLLRPALAGPLRMRVLAFNGSGVYDPAAAPQPSPVLVDASNPPYRALENSDLPTHYEHAWHARAVFAPSPPPP